MSREGEDDGGATGAGTHSSASLVLVWVSDRFLRWFLRSDGRGDGCGRR